MGGTYAPAGWGQPPTGGGATGVPQHGFYTPGNSCAAPNVSTGWDASTTAAQADPAAAEAAEITRFIQTLGGVVGRSHAVIQQNLREGGYTDLWLLKNASVEQMVGTGVLQAHAQYIYAALHQEVMPDSKNWKQFPQCETGWPSQKDVTRFFVDFANVYRGRGESGIMVASYIETCVRYATGVAHLHEADGEFLTAQAQAQGLQISLGAVGDTEVYSKLRSACGFPDRLLDKLPEGVVHSGMMTTFLVVTKSCKSTISSRSIVVQKFSASGMTPHPANNFKGLIDAIENWESLRTRLGSSAGDQEHQMASFKVLVSNYPECEKKLTILQELHPLYVPIDIYVQSCSRLASSWSQDAKTEDELAKLFPGSGSGSARVYSAVGDSKLPAELDRRSDKGTCNVHLDSISLSAFLNFLSGRHFVRMSA